MFASLLTAATAFPTAIYTVLLGVVLVYWLLAIIGMVDFESSGIDLDIETHADAAVDDLGTLASYVVAFGLHGVPFSIVVSLLVLVVTGFMFWRPWFTPYFTIPVMRIAVLLHSIAAVVLVLSVIVHIYAAIWVKGTMRAMTRGTVSEGWARQNHALWHREMTQGK